MRLAQLLLSRAMRQSRLSISESLSLDETRAVEQADAAAIATATTARQNQRLIGSNGVLIMAEGLCVEVILVQMTLRVALVHLAQLCSRRRPIQLNRAEGPVDGGLHPVLT